MSWRLWDLPRLPILFILLGMPAVAVFVPTVVAQVATAIAATFAATEKGTFASAAESQRVPAVPGSGNVGGVGHRKSANLRRG